MKFVDNSVSAAAHRRVICGRL